MSDSGALWERYRQYLVDCPSIGLRLDISRMRFGDAYFAEMQDRIERAFVAMDALERGAIANPDEKRMVGHYWLRNAALAPTEAIRGAITGTYERVVRFAADLHAGSIRPVRAAAFKNVLVIGIGGSALGPQLVSAALGTPRDKMRAFFFDNTDPDGFDRTLSAIEAAGGLAETLTVVISKSGGTKETRNGMLEAKDAYERQELPFEAHAVAVTGEGSELDRTAKKEGWITTFPMWDWVGGRTSELSAVGLLPAALQGIDTRAMLDGARETDALTRIHDARKNPAAVLALMWYFAGRGHGEKSMVVLPYKDRLELFSRYLQQLVMESLGKEKDLEGRVVHQGLTVFGNKGSTDQHAYVQQLRDGPDDFFATFIRVLDDRDARKLFEVEPGITSGDYLHGFLLGTRHALYEGGHDSMTITLEEVSPRTMGVLIALYERAVGLYASLIHINAYHQPGVEAGKKAAAHVLSLQTRIMDALGRSARKPLRAEELAEAIGAPEEVETVALLLEHLAKNPGRGVVKASGEGFADAQYRSS
jgi:glucose-6-phosphate isomerase